MTKPRITYERASEILEYNPVTGWLTWKITRNKAKAGHRAGFETMTTPKHNYSIRKVKLDGVLYSEHHIALLLTTGKWPLGHIDHQDHDGTNNILSNLKETTHQGNCRNRKLNKNSKTGVMGVGLDKNSMRYYARIKVNGKLINLGRFDTIEEATAARRKADVAYGFHENHGKPKPTSPLQSVPSS